MSEVPKVITCQCGKKIYTPDYPSMYPDKDVPLNLIKFVIANV